LYAAIIVGLLQLGCLTAVLPALRAARTDPMLVLRNV
jgi:ABC-type lipoprotein release transport system permease subunit